MHWSFPLLQARESLRSRPSDNPHIVYEFATSLCTVLHNFALQFYRIARPHWELKHYGRIKLDAIIAIARLPMQRLDCNDQGNQLFRVQNKDQFQSKLWRHTVENDMQLWDLTIQFPANIEMHMRIFVVYRNLPWVGQILGEDPPPTRMVKKREEERKER